MDYPTTPPADGQRLTPEELESIAAGANTVTVVGLRNGTWEVSVNGMLVSVCPSLAMATELELWLNDPRGNPRPAWLQ